MPEERNHKVRELRAISENLRRQSELRARESAKLTAKLVDLHKRLAILYNPIERDFPADVRYSPSRNPPERSPPNDRGPNGLAESFF